MGLDPIAFGFAFVSAMVMVMLVRGRVGRLSAVFPVGVQVEQLMRVM